MRTNKSYALVTVTLASVLLLAGCSGEVVIQGPGGTPSSSPSGASGSPLTPSEDPTPAEAFTVPENATEDFQGLLSMYSLADFMSEETATESVGDGLTLNNMEGQPDTVDLSDWYLISEDTSIISVYNAYKDENLENTWVPSEAYFLKPGETKLTAYNPDTQEAHSITITVN